MSAGSHHPDRFLQSRWRHAVLAQLHRWFQVYERTQTEATVQNQLDILADDVMIETFTHSSKGKERYRDRLSFYQDSRNAHHIEQATVRLHDENTAQLDATILYQGISAVQQRRNYRVHYQTLLTNTGDVLPHFTHIKLAVGDQASAALFKEAYAYNRAVSLMHYWLYCVETARGEVGRFRELLAKEFELHFSATGTVKTWEQFEAWIKGSASQVNASAHDEHHVMVSEKRDGTILLSMEFAWCGLSGKDEPMVAKTRHEWELVNNPEERFARVRKMVVTQVEAFRVLEEVDAEA